MTTTNYAKLYETSFLLSNAITDQDQLTYTEKLYQEKWSEFMQKRTI